MSDLNIDVDSFKRVDLITINGRVDSQTTPQLDEIIQNLAENGRHKYVFELSTVSYLSSAGLRVLISTMRSSKKKGGDICLASPSEQVKKVLDLAGLTDIFTTYDSAVAAVGSF